MSYPKSVRIVEVGPRDGLQNESRIIPAREKVALIEALVNAGIRDVECGSFVSPKWVPQMADTDAVLAQLRRESGVAYSVLVPNERGLEQAMKCGVREIAVFTAASETFSVRNSNASVEESLNRIRRVVEQATPNGIRVRGYVSCVLGCPYEGDVPVEAVTRVARKLFDIGCYEISLGDTIGLGTPLKAQTTVKAVAEDVPISRLAVHFHDTYGQALANILACIQLGIAVIDSSVAGLGGCPYAPGASGNVATEEVLYMLHGIGIQTGVDLTRVAAVGRSISEQLGRKSGSKVAAALEVGSCSSR